MPTENESTTCHITQNVFEYQQPKVQKIKAWKIFYSGKNCSLPEILMLFLPKTKHGKKRKRQQYTTEKKYCYYSRKESRRQ